MQLYRSTHLLTCSTLLLACLSLTGCYKPPYNHFDGAKPSTNPLSMIGSAMNEARLSLYKNKKKPLLESLNAYDIEYIKYGDTVTLVLPTDKYYQFNSARFNQLAYPGLACILKLSQEFPNCPVYVAAFTDNVGSIQHKKLITQGRAETMITFLWANGIPSQRLNAEGYADSYPVGNNRIIHGSAQNRRLEIQFLANCPRYKTSFVGYQK